MAEKSEYGKLKDGADGLQKKILYLSGNRCVIRESLSNLIKTVADYSKMEQRSSDLVEINNLKNINIKQRTEIKRLHHKIAEANKEIRRLKK